MGQVLAEGLLHARRRRQRKVSLRRSQRPATRGEDLWVSCGVNAQHGQRRTNANKRRVVMKLLTDDERSRWSDREIARRCAVGHVFVKEIQSELSVHREQIAAPSRLVSRGGITYEMRTDKIGGGQKKAVGGNGGGNEVPPGPRISAGHIGAASATNQIDSRVDRPQRRFQDIPLALTTLHGVCEAFIARDFSGADPEQLEERGPMFTAMMRELRVSRASLYRAWKRLRHGSAHMPYVSSAELKAVNAEAQDLARRVGLTAEPLLQALPMVMVVGRRRIPLTLPPAAHAALALGIQCLYDLGMRPTELQQCLALTAATLKRVAPQNQPDPAKGPPIPPSRPVPLLAAHRRFLTLYWVQVIARDQPIPPPIPKRPLLGAFCPVCLHNPSPAVVKSRPAFPKTLPQSLAHATLIGLAACEAGYRPCASGPVRFASLMLGLRISPWPAAVFLATEVSPSKWWLRTCLRCGQPIVTPQTSLQLCDAHAPMA